VKFKKRNSTYIQASAVSKTRAGSCGAIDTASNKSQVTELYDGKPNNACDFPGKYELLSWTREAESFPRRFRHKAFPDKGRLSISSGNAWSPRKTSSLPLTLSSSISSLERVKETGSYRLCSAISRADTWQLQTRRRPFQYSSSILPFVILEEFNINPIRDLC